MNGTPYRELLAQQGGGFTEPEVRDLLAAVLPQLMHLHQQGTAHGGVSPDTLVHDSISQHTHLIPAQPLTDSSYLAPECLQTGQATATGDVYGLGVTLLTLLTGQSPLVLQPSPGIWNWRAYCSVSHPLAALIDKTIAFHPQLRFADAMQVFQALQTLSEPYHSSAPTADPPTQTTPYTTPTSSATVPVAPIAASSTANLTAHRRFPWPWVAMGVGSLLLLSLVSLAAARFFNPSREPVSPSPTDSASELSPLPDAEPPAEETADPSDSPNPDTDNPFAQESFPKVTCGDAMPTDLAAFPVEFHPVFVPNRQRNLQRIQARFCQDALSVTRKDTAEPAIQVASFTSLERAEQFQQFLDDEFRDAEIGQATVYDRPSESDRPDSGQPDQSDQDKDQDKEQEQESAPNDPPPVTNTERVSFAPGEIGTSLRGKVSADQIQRYLINCGQAQQFTLRIENGNVEAAVISPDGAILGSAVKEGSQWQGTLPSTGDYTLEVIPLERNSGYRISIDVL